MAVKTYGEIDTYKGYALVRFDDRVYGDVIRIYDGLMPRGPNIEKVSEAKKYIDQNL